jgi:hypothetical protein
MENFALLGSLAERLHLEFQNMFYVLLPVFFMLAIVFDWFRNPAGSADFIETLKRAIVATILVVGYQEIANAILAITSGIADRISDMSGLDSIMQMASEKAKTYSMSTTSLLLGFNDLVVSIITFLSYVILFIARYITVALYHFMWLFLSILSPILILFHLFRGTSQITVNLFKSLIEVASYKIIWAVLSAMITSLAFGQAYQADGNYLTIVLINFIIALAMLSTPLVVKSLVGGGLSSMSEALGMGAAVAMVAAPVKAATVVSSGREIMGNPNGFGNYLKNQFAPQGRFGPPPSPPPPPHPSQASANKFSQQNSKLL